MVLLRHITAPSPAYAVHYQSAVYIEACCESGSRPWPLQGGTETTGKRAHCFEKPLCFKVDLVSRADHSLGSLHWTEDFNPLHLARPRRSP